MKVGLIGLGRMGEGMSRRMMKEGIEVWGYRRNYAKAQEAYEKGYVSGVATSLESLVQVVHNQDGLIGKSPGVFQLVIPAELVEETLNELLPFCMEGDIIIDHGNSTDITCFKRFLSFCIVSPVTPNFNTFFHNSAKASSILATPMGRLSALLDQILNPSYTVIVNIQNNGTDYKIQDQGSGHSTFSSKPRGFPRR